MVLSFAHTGALPLEFVTLLLPDASLRSGLGRLERMPDQAGVRGYRYEREKQKWTANVTLPSGLDGDFVWQGKSFTLHAGQQQLSLP